MPQNALFELTPVDDDGFSYYQTREQSEAAMRSLEDALKLDSDKSEMKSVYYLLLSKGFGWRQAAWVAWESLPVTVREPKTLERFAQEILGLSSSRVVYEWKKKYPELVRAVEVIKANQFLVARDEVINAVIKVAKRDDYKSFNHQKMVLTATGDIADEHVHRLVIEDDRDVKSLSYEELQQLENELMLEASTRLLDEIVDIYDEDPIEQQSKEEESDAS